MWESAEGSPYTELWGIWCSSMVTSSPVGIVQVCDEFTEQVGHGGGTNDYKDESSDVH